jgi:Protein of unknown function (DUF3617)
MRSGASGHFDRISTTRWISSVGNAVAVAIFMAAPAVSAQSSAADRPMHVGCSAMVASATLGASSGGAADVAAPHGPRHRVTVAGPHVRGFAQAPNIQPGQYEGTGEVTMSGSPVKLAPSTTTFCINEKDRPGFPPAPSGYTCTVTEYNQDGNKVTMTRVCKGNDNTLTQHGEVTFASNAYSGTWNMTNTSGRNWSMKFSAKRIGDCPK